MPSFTANAPTTKNNIFDSAAIAFSSSSFPSSASSRHPIYTHFLLLLRRPMLLLLLFLLPIHFIPTSVITIIAGTYAVVAASATSRSSFSSVPLRCYDSASAVPSRVAICKEDEICYSEYYALNTSLPHQPLAHYFDRFCIHKRHCIDRGMWPEQRPCISFRQLDPVVARTFKKKLRSERLDPSKLVHSHFCCCSNADLCNELDPERLQHLFNLSAEEEEHHYDFNPTSTSSAFKLQHRKRPRKGGGNNNSMKHGESDQQPATALMRGMMMAQSNGGAMRTTTIINIAVRIVVAAFVLLLSDQIFTS